MLSATRVILYIHSKSLSSFFVTNKTACCQIGKIQSYMAPYICVCMSLLPAGLASEAGDHEKANPCM